MHCISFTSKLYFKEKILINFLSFELSDTIKSQLHDAMGFSTGSKRPKTYALNFFANADDQQERTVGFMIRYVDGVKNTGLLHHYGLFCVFQC